eukprot:1155994-Pelagomonas_calceolata.AAC.5
MQLMYCPLTLYDRDTVCTDPFFQAMPAHFGMSFKELLAAKHPTAWVGAYKLGHGADGATSHLLVPVHICEDCLLQATILVLLKQHYCLPLPIGLFLQCLFRLKWKRHRGIGMNPVQAGSHILPVFSWALLNTDLPPGASIVPLFICFNLMFLHS